jgi:adenylate kinase
MRIIITGSPGTGKSTLSKKLAVELGLELIEIKKIIIQKKLINKKHEVDIEKLAMALRFLKNKRNYLVEGHLACELRIPADTIIVLRTHPKVLKTRFRKRKYGKKKTEDNLVVEMIDYCTQKIEAVYKLKPLELDTSKHGIEESVDLIKKAIKHKKKKIDLVDYSGSLIRDIHGKRGKKTY